MKRNYLLPLIILLFSITPITAQQNLTGAVKDVNGEPLPGATVVVKDSENGAATDINGKFSIADVDGTDVLVVSYIGYRTAHINVDGRQHIDIILNELPTKLGEVVITGYSEISASKRIASVAVLNAEQLENTPLTDINKVLQGNAAGVYSTALSGQPGAMSDVRIRGTGSISAGRAPLYVVDGVIMLTGLGAALGPGGIAPDLLAQFNPNDIESITILKDASATALYGARGSNGVIVITTKRGKAGKTKITAKTQVGMTIPTQGNLKMMSAEQQWNYDRKVLANTPNFTQAQINLLRPTSLLDNTTDWVEEAFNTGSTYNLEVQASGGNDKTRFFASGGWFDQQGILFGTDFKRLTLRSNIDHYASDRLNFSLNLNGSYSTQNHSGNGFNPKSLYMKAYTTTPLQGKTNPATGKLYTGLESDWTGFLDNFLYSRPLNSQFTNTFRLLTKLSATYKILENLHFTQNANVDWVTINETNFDDPTTSEGAGNKGYLANGFHNFRTLTTQSHLKYSTQIGAHSLDGLGIVEYQRSDDEHFKAAGKGFASGKLQTLDSAAEPVEASGNKSRFAFLSFLGQVNYGFKDRYVLQATLRRDGSSRFGANNRWANFWSVGASWHISDGGFLKDWDLVDNLRLRTGFGTSGNADIGNFTSLELYSFGENYFNLPGSALAQISNPDLSWEKSSSLNIGLDFLILDNRIGGTVEWYHRITKDLLFDIPVSATTGFNTSIQNTGKIRNTGVEVVLNLIPIEAANTGGVSWNVDFNFSYNDDEILELPNGADIVFGPFNHLIYREGLPVNSMRMQKWAGVNPDDGTPLWELPNGELTGDYSKAGVFIVGKSTPDFIAGLTNTFHFKGFSLSCLLYTAQGGLKRIDYSNSAFDGDGFAFGFRQRVEAADHWEKPGDIAKRPKPMLGGNNMANSASTRYLGDGSYIRLRDITLSYRFPVDWMQKVRMQGITLYVQGQNLWTHTDYHMVDPESGELGLETMRYPSGKSFVFGADVTF